MEIITTVQVIEALKHVVKELEGAKDKLCLLDSKVGDGDLGVTMALGAQAVGTILQDAVEKDIGILLGKCGMAFNKAAPSTMGTLTATALISAGKEVKGKEVLAPSDLVAMAQAMELGIRNRGKAKIGDKTVLDALKPAVVAFKNAIEAQRSLKEALEIAALAARNGAEATATMTAKIGRSSWLGERTRGHPDGGAVVCQIITETLAGHWQEISGGKSE